MRRRHWQRALEAAGRQPGGRDAPPLLQMGSTHLVAAQVAEHAAAGGEVMQLGSAAKPAGLERHGCCRRSTKQCLQQAHWRQRARQRGWCGGGRQGRRRLQAGREPGAPNARRAELHALPAGWAGGRGGQGASSESDSKDSAQRSCSARGLYQMNCSSAPRLPGSRAAHQGVHGGAVFGRRAWLLHRPAASPTVPRGTRAGASGPATHCVSTARALRAGASDPGPQLLITSTQLRKGAQIGGRGRAMRGRHNAAHLPWAIDQRAAALQTRMHTLSQLG